VKVAATPPNVTLVAPVKLLPRIVTDVPTGPITGENAVTTKSVGLIALPSDAVSAILPVAAASGTVAVIRVALLIVKKAALVPLNVTAVTPVRSLPTIAITSPTPPAEG
jgi:hypothetical protein